MVDGRVDGDREGVLLGDLDGFVDGEYVGLVVGSFEGDIVGFFDGVCVGDRLGTNDGAVDGDCEGVLLGEFDGFTDGATRQASQQILAYSKRSTVAMSTRCLVACFSSTSLKPEKQQQSALNNLSPSVE